MKNLITNNIKNILSLAFFILPVLTLTVLLVGCGSSSIPETEKQKILDDYQTYDRGFSGSTERRNQKLEVVGAGKVTNMDKIANIDSVVCWKVRYESKKDDVWQNTVKSGITTRSGNLYSSYPLDNTGWDIQSCPTPYEDCGESALNPC